MTHTDQKSRRKIEAKRKLEERLGYELPKRAADILDRRCYLDGVAAYGETGLDEAGQFVQDCVAVVNELLKSGALDYSALGSGPDKEASAHLARTDPEDSSTYPPLALFPDDKALSVLVAQEAAEDPWVQWFRNEVLPSGECLKEEEVEPWIQRQATLDGPPGGVIYLEIPSLYTDQIKVSPEAITVDPSLPLVGSRVIKKERPTHLVYILPGEKQPRCIHIAPHGKLAQLMGLSKYLAEKYHWLKAEAVLFVLTDIPPQVMIIDSSIKLGWVTDDPRPFARFFDGGPTSSSRINLSIHPACTRQVVANFYARLQQSIIAKRQRSLSGKRLELAKFVATHSQKGKSLRRLREEWDKCYPDWRFSDPRNFATEYKVARQHLLNPDYEYQIQGFANPYRQL